MHFVKCLFCHYTTINQLIIDYVGYWESSGMSNKYVPLVGRDHILYLICFLWYQINTESEQTWIRNRHVRCIKSNSQIIYINFRIIIWYICWIFLSNFEDTLLGVIEKEPQSCPAFQNSSLFSTWWQRWKIPPQLCSNGRWTVRFTHSMAKEAKESVLLKTSPRLQATWRDKSSFNSTNFNTWRYLLTLDSVQTIITKAVWKIKSEPCINLLLRKWKPYCLLTNNWELIFPS